MGRSPEDSWFRLPVGIFKDQKLLAATRNAGCTISECVAVWVSVLEHATSHKPPGSVETLDAEIVGIVLDMSAKAVQDLLDQFVAMEMIIDGKVANWWRLYDPKNLRSNSKAWRTLRDAVFHRDNHTCVYCGNAADKLECDHVIPVSRGGSHDPSNLVTACVRCNRSKNDMTAAEWLGGVA